MKENEKEARTLEITLILITLALMCLMWSLASHKLIVLNLFYLPVVLAGFFLGRYRAGVMASLAVIAASVVATQNLNDFGSFNSPLIVGLTVALWACVLGLIALLVGTLSDERNETLNQLHDAHVGVVEVLARYLQSAHPNLKNSSLRIAELSKGVARELKLPLRDCDDIRVAALLHDMENIEITARVIRKAIGELESNQDAGEHSFHGSELAQSLGTALSGAFPLLMSQVESAPFGPQTLATTTAPLGARIIRTVRAYDTYSANVRRTFTERAAAPIDILSELRRNVDAEYPEQILDALERVVTKGHAVAIKRIPEEVLVGALS